MRKLSNIQSLMITAALSGVGLSVFVVSQNISRGVSDPYALWPFYLICGALFGACAWLAWKAARLLWSVFSIIGMSVDKKREQMHRERTMRHEPTFR